MLEGRIPVNSVRVTTSHLNVVLRNFQIELLLTSFV